MAIAAVAGLLILLAASELVLPRVLERYLAKRLTESGGHARVHLRAFPAARLLMKRGTELRVRASGLKAGARADSDGEGGLSRLDGFENVDIQVVGVRLGPLDVSRLTLLRGGHEPYRVRAEGSVRGTPLPVDVTAVIEHDGATSISGSVAGLPAGVLVDFIVAALASRL